MASPTNVRFPQQVDRSLSEYARQSGAKKSTVVVNAVSEWLRMQRHPGIMFVTTVTGERRAALATGPQVWTIAESWLQHEKNERAIASVADALGLLESEVNTALAYWADYRDEIDELIRREQTNQDEALAAWERRRALDAI
jgi:hypothetical protein